MKTSQKQISLFTEEQLTSLPEDSHANHTQWQASDLERKMSDTSGQTCLERFGKFSRHGLWAKTFSALLIGQEGWYSTKCRLIWKLKGTKYNRMYFQLAPSTLPTEETGFGLLPTPTAIQRDHPERVQALKETEATTMFSRANGEARPNSIIDHLQFHGMLPTPTLQDARIGINNIEGSKHRMERGSVALADIALGLTNRMLPTPTAMDSNGATANMKSTQVKEGSMHSVTLSRMLLQTPRASDKAMHWKTKNWKGDDLGSQINEMLGTRSHLSPPFVLEMMGFPPDWTLQPFLSQSGETNQSKPEEMP